MQASLVHCCKSPNSMCWEILHLLLRLRTFQVDAFLVDKSLPIWKSLSAERMELYRDIRTVTYGSSPYLEQCARLLAWPTPTTVCHLLSVCAWHMVTCGLSMGSTTSHSQA